MISGGGCSKQGASAPKRQSQRATRPNSGKTMDSKRSCNMVQRSRLGCLGESQEDSPTFCERMPSQWVPCASQATERQIPWRVKALVDRRAVEAALLGGGNLHGEKHYLPSACHLANPRESAAPAAQIRQSQSIFGTELLLCTK